MTTDTLIEIFKVQDTRIASHMMTDVPFWSKQYTLLSQGNLEHISAMQQVISNQTTYLEKLKKKGLKGKDEKTFYSEVGNINSIYSEQLAKLTSDAKEYKEIEQSLTSFEDNSNGLVSKIQHRYDTCQTKLDEQTKIVETQKKLYHKLEFRKEKTDIKLKMAYQPDVIDDTKKRIEELDQKIKAQRDKYVKHLDKWKTRCADLRKISDDFEVAFKSREEARAKVILTALQNGVDLTMAGNYAKREAAFSHIIEKRFIKGLAKRGTINTQTFQEYVGEADKDGMYKAALAELNGKDNHTENRHPDDEQEDATRTCEVNKRLSDITQATEYVVVKAYAKREINQLKLKLGQHVTQLLPPNDDGFAFGQTVQGLLHRKKKGFYPVSNVAKLQVADPVNDSKSNEQTARKSTRLNKERVQDISDDKKTRKCKRNEIKEEDVSKVTANKQAWEGDKTQPGPNDGAAKKIGSEARKKRREARNKTEDLVMEFV